ncbi:MAG: hypothetical protein IPG43_04165 [Proteobacteria bacterium]|nr:hypothetical protein [Pseudomonadota bacterium]
MMRCLALLLACLCGLAPLLVAADDAIPQPSASPSAPAPLAGERFDCENAFDLIALMVVARCSLYQAPAAAAAAIDAAATRLRGAGLASEDELRASHIAFCPLAAGTGMVPAPGQLYLDDGLVGLSSDGLAEILAHELEHIRQFQRLGTREFKCEYVRDMLACGGCQDRGHALEAQAYERQDEVRERLLKANP